MKGIVFIILNEMVEEKHGIEVWEQILIDTRPESEGIYVATESYSDDELSQIVLAISETLAVPTTEITRVFGRHLFGELNRRYPMFTESCKDFFDFLSSIENVIHKEVRKLYSQASLPTLACNIRNDKEMDIVYSSPRKLCLLAEGLIHGAAEHYNEHAVIEHPVCMHKGAESCKLRIRRE